MTDTPADYLALHATYAQRVSRESRRQRRAQPEYAEQCAFFERVRWARKRYPDELGYQLCFAVPNGAHLEKKMDRNGEWVCPQGTRLWKAGMEAGIPDILVLAPSRHWHYLAIELKAAGNSLSAAQKEKRDLIREAGGAYAVCRSGESAWETLQGYLRGVAP